MKPVDRGNQSAFCSPALVFNRFPTISRWKTFWIPGYYNGLFINYGQSILNDRDESVVKQAWEQAGLDSDQVRVFRPLLKEYAPWPTEAETKAAPDDELFVWLGLYLNGSDGFELFDFISDCERAFGKSLPRPKKEESNDDDLNDDPLEGFLRHGETLAKFLQRINDWPAAFPDSSLKSHWRAYFWGTILIAPMIAVALFVGGAVGQIAGFWNGIVSAVCAVFYFLIFEYLIALILALLAHVVLSSKKFFRKIRVRKKEQ